jgi:type II secretory pathway component GspD/PulD (secretin)
MKFGTFATIAIALTLAGVPRPTLAQQSNSLEVSLDLQDAPVRTTVEAIFKQAGIKNYIIDNAVAGFVTLKITDQPMESALKLTLRASSMPLTYTKENDVWIVKPRSLPTAGSLAAPPDQETSAAPSSPRYERISLTYLDPADLTGILGEIIMIRHFTRQMGGPGFSTGNGLLGRGNGASGGGVLLGQGGNPPLGQNGTGSGGNGPILR